jgi:hypothetical protein
MSGLAPLLLSKPELSLVKNHHKETIQNLLPLLPNTPQCVLNFLAGSLPGEALVHLRQFSLSMIMELKDSILQKHTINVFSSKRSSGSWLYSLRNLCLQYQLPHPITLLDGFISKVALKILAKKHVWNYWEIKLCEEASPLLSLIYFKPAYMSLAKPHPIFTTA